MNLTVNGEVVSREAVEREYQRLLKAVRAHCSPEELSRSAPALQRQALDYAIGRLLLLNEARRRNIQIPRETIDRAVEEMTRSCGGGAGFQAHLNKLNLSLEALRRQIEDARLTETLIEQITAACPKPTEEEVTACFKDHAPAFIGKNTQPESVPSPETLRRRIRLSLAVAKKNEHLAAFIARLRRSAVIQESARASA